MRRLDENKIIKIFQNSFNNRNFVPEDVEFFNFGKTKFVISTDTFVESIDMPSQMSLRDVARKSIVACVSDFASKGVSPRVAVVSVTIPRTYSESKIIELSKGLGSASKEFGFKILGGDTSEGKELSIQVTLVGFSKRVIPRGGSRRRDLIFVTGTFGYTKIGLHILLKNRPTSKNFAKKATTRVFHPSARLQFSLTASRFFSSAMDSSDGLSTTLHEMARQSNHRFVVTKIPTTKEVIEFSKINKLNLHDLVFNGGEEFEIVFTSSPTNKKRLEKIAKRYGISLIEIGFVTNGGGVIRLSEGKSLPLKDAGWRHFKG